MKQRKPVTLALFRFFPSTDLYRKKAFKYCLVDVRGVLVYRRRTQEMLEDADVEAISVREGRFSDCRTFYKGLSPLAQKKLISRWQSRIRDGEKVFIGRLDDEPAHYAWVSLKDEMHLSEIGKAFRLEAGAGFVYDCYTAESFRGRGIYTAVLRQLVEHLKRAAVEQVFIHCDRENVASRKGIESAGFELYSSYTRVKVFGMSCVVERPVEVGAP